MSQISEQDYRNQITKKHSDNDTQWDNAECTAEQCYVGYKCALLNLIKKHDLQWLLTNKDSFVMDVDEKIIKCFFTNTPRKWIDVLKDQLNIDLDTVTIIT